MLEWLQDYMFMIIIAINEDQCVIMFNVEEIQKIQQDCVMYIFMYGEKGIIDRFSTMKDKRLERIVDNFACLFFGEGNTEQEELSKYPVLRKYIEDHIEERTCSDKKILNNLDNYQAIHIYDSIQDTPDALVKKITRVKRDWPGQWFYLEYKMGKEKLANVIKLIEQVHEKALPCKETKKQSDFLQAENPFSWRESIGEFFANRKHYLLKPKESEQTSRLSIGLKAAIFIFAYIAIIYATSSIIMNLGFSRLVCGLLLNAQAYAGSVLILKTVSYMVTTWKGYTSNKRQVSVISINRPNKVIIFDDQGMPVEASYLKDSKVAEAINKISTDTKVKKMEVDLDTSVNKIKHCKFVF